MQRQNRPHIFEKDKCAHLSQSITKVTAIPGRADKQNTINKELLQQGMVTNADNNVREEKHNLIK